MDNSVGANKVLASRSQNRQKDAPPRKQAGIIRIGFAVWNRLFTRCGTAIPTKETGPAKCGNTCGKHTGKHNKNYTEHLYIESHIFRIRFSHLISTDGLGQKKDPYGGDASYNGHQHHIFPCDTGKASL